MRPWDSLVPRPWEAAQPIFDRLVAVHRSKTEAGSGSGAIGLGGYSGPEQPTTTPEGEVVLYTGITAVIQQRSSGRASGGPLPADVSYRPEWVIIIPAFAGVPKQWVRRVGIDPLDAYSPISEVAPSQLWRRGNRELSCAHRPRLRHRSRDACREPCDRAAACQRYAARADRR